MPSSNHERVLDCEDPSRKQSARTNANLTPKPESAYDPKAFKKALRQCIANLSKVPLLSIQDRLGAFPDPGLFVDGVGPIPLPLYKTYTDALLEKGIGNYAEGWHLLDNSFKLENPAWDSYVVGQVEDVAKTLAMEGPVGIGSCSLILHRAEETSSNMLRAYRKIACGSFATLTIVLPSQHEGGHIRVSHANRTEILETAATSKYGLTSLAWYFATSVEFQPLETGSRLLLVYGLNDESKKQENQSPVALEASKLKLQELLGLWNQDYDDHHIYKKQYIYILDKRCKSKALGNDVLEDSDKRRVKQLCDLFVPKGFHVFLTRIEMRQITYPDNPDMEGYWHMEEDELEVGTIYTPKGDQIGSAWRIDLSEILQQHPFKRTPDNSDKEYSDRSDVRDLQINVFYDTVSPTRLYSRSRVSLKAWSDWFDKYRFYTAKTLKR